MKNKNASANFFSFGKRIMQFWMTTAALFSRPSSAQGLNYTITQTTLSPAYPFNDFKLGDLTYANEKISLSLISTDRQPNIPSEALHWLTWNLDTSEETAIYSSGGNSYSFDEIAADFLLDEENVTREMLLSQEWRITSADKSERAIYARILDKSRSYVAQNVPLLFLNDSMRYTFNAVNPNAKTLEIVLGQCEPNVVGDICDRSTIWSQRYQWYADTLVPAAPALMIADSNGTSTVFTWQVSLGLPDNDASVTAYVSRQNNQIAVNAAWYGKDAVAANFPLWRYFGDTAAVPSISLLSVAGKPVVYASIDTGTGSSLERMVFDEREVISAKSFTPDWHQLDPVVVRQLQAAQLKPNIELLLSLEYLRNTTTQAHQLSGRLFENGQLITGPFSIATGDKDTRLSVIDGIAVLPDGSAFFGHVRCPQTTPGTDNCTIILSRLFLTNPVINESKFSPGLVAVLVITSISSTLLGAAVLTCAVKHRLEKRGYHPVSKEEVTDEQPGCLKKWISRLPSLPHVTFFSGKKKQSNIISFETLETWTNEAPGDNGEPFYETDSETGSLHNSSSQLPPPKSR